MSILFRQEDGIRVESDRQQEQHVPYVQLIFGKAKGVRLDLNQQEVTVGRRSSSAIVIDDPAVSDIQCYLVKAGEGYLLREAGSTNGVDSNGQIMLDTELHNGDVLAIGPAELIYCTEEKGGGEGFLPSNSPPFEPVPPKISLLGRICWPFTYEGRARRGLQLACEFPDEPKRTENVTKALFKLRARKGTLSSSARALHADLLVHLVWKALARGDIQQSAEYLSSLDSDFPVLEAKTALRWDFMCALWAEGERDAFVRQAGLFVADVRAANTSRESMVLDVIKTIYEQISPSVCASVIGKAHKTILGRAQVQAALALCTCPPAFADVAEARKWTAQISPDGLSFSMVMAADAHLVAAQAAETENKFEGMLDSALQALRLAPSHRPVLYWLTRTKLHDAKANPAEHLGPVAVSGDSNWDRLALLMTLHQRPSVGTAAATRPMFEGKMGQLAPPEVMLVVELVRRALEPTLPSAPADIEVADSICRSVQKQVGAVPWSQIHIANKLVRLDCGFKSAYELLEQRDVIDQPWARPIARIARILAGTPLKPKSGLNNDALTVMEVAAHRLLAADSANTEPSYILVIQGLQACRQDEVFNQFPDLVEVVAVLVLALRVVGGDAVGAWPELQATKLSKNASHWLVWLNARIYLLAMDICSPIAPSFSPLNTSMPAVAWAIDCWNRNRSRPEATDDAAMKEVRACLERWATKGKANVVVSAILATRKTAYRSFDAAGTPIKVTSVHEELGELADAVCVAELRMEVSYACARQAISQGKAGDAVSDLAALDKGMAQVCDLAVMWWCPLVRYWLGVSHAHQQNKNAAAILQGLVGGPRDNESRAQLSLLALRDGLVTEAAQRLEGASDSVPSVRYARALTLARSGKPLEARQLLGSDDAARVFAESVYALPAHRLAAAIEERCDNRDEGDRLNGAVLEAHPDDEVAGIRLGRSLLERAYSQFRTQRSMPGASIGNLLQNLIPAIRTNASWWQSCVLLNDLMNAPDDGLSDLAKKVEAQSGDVERSLAWRQVLALRFVVAGNPAGALAVLDIPVPAGAPAWFVRSRLILKIWQSLIRLPEETGRAEAVQELAGLARECESFGVGDATGTVWRTLADLGVILGSGRYSVPPERWRSLASSPMAHIPFLFDSDPKQRRIAAEALLPAIDSNGIMWNEEQRLLLHALAAWAAEKDDLYVEQYSYLEPVLDELPACARDLWASAALIRYSRADWEKLTGDELPECLADMSDPLVCLILELADARATVGDLKNPSQKVAQKIKGIHSNLAALVEKLDAQKSVPAVL